MVSLLNENIGVSTFISSKMEEFETMHKLHPKREKALLYGSLIMYICKESFRVFKIIGNLDIKNHLTIMENFDITTSQDAIDRLDRLVAAKDRSNVAQEIYQYFIVESNPVPLDFSNLVTPGLEKTLAGCLSSTIHTTKSYLEKKPQKTKVEEETVWKFFAQKYMIEKIHDSLDSYNKNLDIFPKAGIFTKEELRSVTNFSALDLGRVVYMAKIGTHIGYIEEETAWHYIETAAKKISETYSSWNELYKSYVMGRALGLSVPATDLINGVDFLLNHEKSPVKDLSFKYE